MPHAGGFPLKTPLVTAAVWPPFLSTDKPFGSPARVLAVVTKKGGGLISTVFKVRSEIMAGLFTSGL